MFVYLKYDSLFVTLGEEALWREDVANGLDLGGELLRYSHASCVNDATAFQI